MKFFEKIKDHMLYGTLSKSIFFETIPLMTEENNSNLKGISMITTVFGGVLTVLSFFGILSKRVLPAYLFLFLTSLLFIIIRRLTDQTKRYISYITCLTQCITVMTFGLLNSTICSPSPTTNGTIFCVLMIVIPLIIIDLPYRIDTVLIIITIAYCFMSYKYKDPSVLSADHLNALVVCLCSIMTNWIFAGRNMQNLANRLYIQKKRDTDALTGLLTKKAAQIIIDTHFIKGREGVFFIIDLDNFKHVNDTYGHLYGDRVLKLVASCIKSNITRKDVGSRFGGDEFTVLYPDMTLEEAEKLAESFFNDLNNAFLNEKHHQTCSMGITDLNGVSNYEQLFQKADSALYDSKLSGKNKYTIV
ncbi:MAG: GGDEF domain-containing protein [Lachnospiraceae bacterium]|jgi:diguanylate cyclase (GGDEF)-like protein|nr:GGDEF domain-containing protein [Lachnospiraceae bacterium]MEE3461149.1 GGDEF domain-containing protein [Lachnospiraceae bacterium]